MIYLDEFEFQGIFKKLAFDILKKSGGEFHG